MSADRILFYSDMSQASDLAFPLALDLAISQRSNRLYVVHVLYSPYRFRGDIIEPGLAMGLNPEIVDVAERSLKDRYEPAMKGYKGASFHVLKGVAGVEVLRFIRKHNVEQVVLARLVAERALPNMPCTLESMLQERSPCPILFVAPGRKALAGGDESASVSEDPHTPPRVIHMDRYRILLQQRRRHREMRR